MTNITHLNGIFLVSIQGSVILCIFMHRGKHLARLYLGPDSHSYETQATNWCLNAAHIWNPRKRAPSHGSLTGDLATEDDCNSRTDEVYTNVEIVIITFLNARLNQYLVSKIQSKLPQIALLKECYSRKINLARDCGDSCGRIVDIFDNHGQPTKS